MNKKSILGAATAAALVAGGLASVAAASGDDADDNATGPGADVAVAAAVKAAGGGKLSSVEKEDEGSVAWEVEIVQPDGTVMEFDLDADNKVLASEEDD